MNCPSCGSVNPPSSETCSACGASLSDDVADATQKLERPTATLGPEVEAEAPTRRIPSPTRARTDLLAAAGFAFLALVCCGAILALAGKLQYSSLGAGADPVSVLTGVVMAGLAVLGAAVHIGDLSVSATPLGALLAVGTAGAWATARAVRGVGPRDLYAATRWGATVALPFAAICWIAALVFRIRQGPTTVSLDGTSVIVFSAMWGAAFGIVGGVLAYGPRRAFERWHALVGERRWIAEAVVLAGWTLAGFAIAGVAAGLLWIIFALISGGPATGLGIGGLLAGLIYVIAFAPNLVVSIVALSLGAPIRIGAAVSQKGRQIGELADHSLFAWPGGKVPAWVYLLVLIPPAITLAVGFYSARRDRATNYPSGLVIACAAVVGFAIFELAGLSEARLGAGLVRNKGVALAAPGALAAGILAFVWTAGGMTAAWFVHRRRVGGRRPVVET